MPLWSPSLSVSKALEALFQGPQCVRLSPTGRLQALAGLYVTAGLLPLRSRRQGRGGCLHARGDPAASHDGPGGLPRRRHGCTPWLHPATAPAASEASPHKRRLKCDTNISPRRLMTHLLHQMVHHRTTLRVNGQRSATIARITTHTHTMILNIKRRSSESCPMR